MRLKPEIFKINHHQTDPQNGSLLISEPLLNESYFQRGVILMIEHNARGSMGLVLNKQTGLTLNSLIDGIGDLAEIPVFCGGPLANDRLFYIHTLGYLIPDSIEIGHGLYIDGNFDAIVSYLKSGNDIEDNIKFVIGYSGWDGDQLDEEIQNNTWAVNQKMIPRQCITGDGDAFWKEAVKGLGEKYKTWLNYPKIPYLN